MSNTGVWTKNFFYCHREDSCYSDEFCVEQGHYAKVRLFSDNDCNYYIAPEEGVSDCLCGPRRQWFNARTIECKHIDPVTGEVGKCFRPHVLRACTSDEYLELGPGRYRFCVLNCHYEPVTPAEDDILLRVQHCIDNRMGHIAPQITY